MLADSGMLKKDPTFFIGLRAEGIKCIGGKKISSEAPGMLPTGKEKQIYHP